MQGSGQRTGGQCTVWMYGIPASVETNDLEGLTSTPVQPCPGFLGVDLYQHGGMDLNEEPRKDGGFAVFSFSNFLSASQSGGPTGP